MSRIHKSTNPSASNQQHPKSIPEKRQGQLLEHIDDEVLSVNVLRNNLKTQAATITAAAAAAAAAANSTQGSLSESSSTPLKETIAPTLEQEISLQEKSDQLADENWHIATEYYKNIDTKAFRQYELACDRVKSFYEEQHAKQTVAYNIQARINFKTKTRDTMSVWQALEKLNKLLDESDPDTELSQISHALQTAEAIRRDGKPRWFQLVGLIHDLGKLLYFYDSRGQWDVVGDTFPVGCKFSKRIIFPDSFKANPDFLNPLYNTKYGIYSKHCGLDKVMLSWGHDEYMFHIAKKYSKLPKEGLAMIRYHSFYPWHQEMAYTYLMNDHDKEMLKAVKAFNQYDLYSKIDREYDVDELKPYYLELIDEFFPDKVIDF
ncbi:inositol oxygenase [Candida orthopsilosis Co 90-125]|uniref:Inositol oxygenase n=1 Tax=Candida orthopsilosis (strain 90-125) TaxID=1136231 RepID=H8X0Q9_CANO9|nr:inositol oxygenase [Candida orthopsilosis Co 90-125]CCG21948.1 inositol oxygenase [Candida orthopsilosis Co 90-125]